MKLKLSAVGLVLAALISTGAFAAFDKNMKPEQVSKAVKSLKDAKSSALDIAKAAFESKVAAQALATAMQKQGFTVQETVEAMTKAGYPVAEITAAILEGNKEATAAGAGNVIVPSTATNAQAPVLAFSGAPSLGGGGGSGGSSTVTPPVVVPPVVVPPVITPPQPPVSRN